MVKMLEIVRSALFIAYLSKTTHIYNLFTKPFGNYKYLGADKERLSTVLKQFIMGCDL